MPAARRKEISAPLQVLVKPSCYSSKFSFKALENQLFHEQTGWQLVLCLVPGVLCPALPPLLAQVPMGPQCSHRVPSASRDLRQEVLLSLSISLPVPSLY